MFSKGTYVLLHSPPLFELSPIQYMAVPEDLRVLLRENQSTVLGIAVSHLRQVKGKGVPVLNEAQCHEDVGELRYSFTILDFSTRWW
jgi:hypothetical protein